MNFGQLVAFHEDGGWQNFIDIAGYEGVANPDGGALDSNPYALFAYGDGFVVADAGGNDLLHAWMTGTISTMAVFPDVMVEFPPGSGSMIPMQAVPTSVSQGPDGAYYVGELTGFPSPVGGADVYRGTDSGFDTYASGFTNILDTAFDPEGNLYVVEMAHEGLLSGSPFGALYRVAPDGSKTMITGDLFLPTGLAYGPDGALRGGIRCGAGHGPRRAHRHHRLGDGRARHGHRRRNRDRPRTRNERRWCCDGRHAHCAD
ncbi:MAG: ScyD/ScyE family protein [Anaerolineae bacterium]|nr:ScyD/ScyE family protein [Anaerolineae bacterium]